MKLVLHIGLPKTATTTLQTWADTHRAALQERGVIYPEPRVVTDMPKHQELVRGIVSGAFDDVDDLLSEARPDHTLFLSAEGLTGHLPEAEARPENLEAFRNRLSRFELSLLLTTRATEPWLKSYHKQKICNPPNTLYGHGTTLTLGAFAREPRIRALMNHEALIERTNRAYQPQSLEIVDLEEDWANRITAVLDAPDMAKSLDDMPRHNTGISDDAAEMMRQVNGLVATQGRGWILNVLRGVEAGAAPPPNLRPIVDQLVAHTPAQDALIANLRNKLK